MTAAAACVDTSIGNVLVRWYAIVAKVDNLREEDGDEEHEDNDASQGYPSSPGIPRRVVTVTILVNFVTAVV